MSLNPDKPTVLPGGLRATVLQMNQRDMVHDAALGSALGGVIEHEAKAHQAVFQAAQFAKVIEAVKAGKISAYFILAGWEHCQPKIAGASIEFPTVITAWDKETEQFKHYPAIYGEDTCLRTPILKALVQERPAGKTLPQGLGAYFEQERIKRWTTNKFGDAPLGMTARGRVGEYSAHSSTMIKLMNGLNATLGTPEDGTILEINGLPRAMQDKWKLPVTTEEIALPQSPQPYPNIFLTRWSGEGGKQQIVASFTNGISTFTGEPVTRVQFTSNGVLPDSGVLHCALASLLAAGQEEIQQRRWGSTHEAKLPASPLIPLHGTNQEIYAALIAASQSEMLLPRIGATLPNPLCSGGHPPLMRLHALQEPAIQQALKNMDAQTRTLGTHPMLPAVIDFSTLPQESLNFDPQPARPVKLIKPTEAAGAAIFSLVG